MSSTERSSSTTLTASLRNIAMRFVGADAVGRLWWRLRGRSTNHLVGNRKNRFEYMYRSGFWVQGKDCPLSGLGSTLEATHSIRNELPNLLRDISTQSLLDVGCGDFTWMKEVDLPCP